MKVAIIGVTGLVGSVMLKVLEEKRINCTEIYPVASSKSIGKVVSFNNKSYKVIGIEDAIAKKPDFALFSAGSNVSLNYAKKFAEVGTIVIDNSSAWRMYPNIKLIVPEVNGNQIDILEDKIIANPNCSTIQLVMVLGVIHKKYKIKRVVISTYQSVTGTGVKAIRQLENERNNIQGEMVYPYPIDMNCLPHAGDFTDNGYTTEELKLINETHKILDPSIKISPTVIRIPVTGGHSESVNIEFENDYDISDVVSLLKNAKGIIVQDSPKDNIYPMPLYAKDKDDVFVGRIRKDPSCEKALNLWIVADNLRKGAATNAVQILEMIAYKKNIN
jgi:aspartate-semialdehyde dehydrogenase